MANRNVNSFFSEVPASLDISRSKFQRDQDIKLTFNTGELIPFYIDEILPGDTMSIDTAKVVRMSTLMTPIMDNIFIDTYFFFVPNRLVWEHWKQFMGENTESAWIPQTHYSIPQVVAPEGGWNNGTIADYLGVPTKIPNISISALPFRAYAMICNEWFRDENLTDPLYFAVSDATVTGSNGEDYINDCYKGGKPFKVAKYHDYFTSALPAPQKGPDIGVPMTGSAPVVTTGNFGGSSEEYVHPVEWGLSNGGNFSQGYSHALLGEEYPTWHLQSQFRAGINETAVETRGLYPLNLIAQFDSQNAYFGSINQLRQAFQVQKFYEKNARSGSRYTEVLKSHFGVSSPDSRLQRPEYLGGVRIPVNINQVVQNSATDDVSPQGHTTAYSLTIDRHSDFTKSFTEHGILIGLMCARYQHTYQQGLERFWKRTLREDFYWPVFANLGEQAIKNYEIFATGQDSDDEVFGFQEAWAEYRYKPSRVAGHMRSNDDISLDVWHLADYYDSAPRLSDSWIREDGSIVDRVLAVSSENAHQFIADIYVKNASVRVMPVYSIPGLIDHH